VKLFEVQSSPIGETSDSIAFSKVFIKASKSDDTSLVADTLNLYLRRNS